MSTRRGGQRSAGGGAGGLRLRPGSDGLVRDQVSEIQRARLLAAATLAVAEHGAGNVTVAHIVERAGVSRRTFYELFRDGEQCLLAAMDDALARAAVRVLADRDRSASWASALRTGLVALLRFFDEEPPLARLLVVESLAGGQRLLERRRDALEPLIAFVEQGNAQRGAAKARPALTGEGVVGGVLAVLHSHLTHGDGSPLTSLANQLMGMVVLPYQGAGAARRELDRPLPSFVPVAKVEDGPLRADPFKDAGMRLTYRTMRVLGVIAELPGASNKKIGALAGVSDQGQISKLLARLERIGLVANSGQQTQGEANVWTLTPAGHQVLRGVRPNASTERARR
ncbi:MAG: TetR family transcriptional regulator [Solirubrobacteraceae bacterium]